MNYETLYSSVGVPAKLCLDTELKQTKLIDYLTGFNFLKPENHIFYGSGKVGKTVALVYIMKSIVQSHRATFNRPTYGFVSDLNQLKEEHLSTTFLCIDNFEVSRNSEFVTGLLINRATKGLFTFIAVSEYERTRREMGDRFKSVVDEYFTLVRLTEKFETGKRVEL